jgi:hypothetical protein
MNKVLAILKSHDTLIFSFGKLLNGIPVRSHIRSFLNLKP